MAEKAYLAVDLGASGGRVFAGIFDGQRLRLEPCHRFEHSATLAGGLLQWDLLALWRHVTDGLRAARNILGTSIRSVGVDTWGVDFALLGRGDVLLGNPVSYRDRRTEGVMDRVLNDVGREAVFNATGVQFMPINTLYQLVAMRQQNSPLLDVAETFLMMPDVINWLLTGHKCNEFTNATTTQCFDPRAHAWATDLLETLRVPTHLFAPLVEPGTVLGGMRAEVASETGLHGVNVVAPGTHDTASAVLAVPTSSNSRRPDWCYISSGTWSLMGVELPEPVISDPCLRLNFTNEGGVGNTIRLLKNITGLWLVQECRRVWEQAGRKYTWETLSGMVAEAEPLTAFVAPDAPQFQAPCDMPEVVRAFCKSTNQRVPSDDAAVTRVCLDSLALRCRYVLGALEELIGNRLDTVHIVGGGTQNRLLCQATADACQRPVQAGPVEATVIGNVLVQAIADGELASIAEARELVRRSFPVESYEPRDAHRWNDAFSRFNELYS
ncbi:MAG TPA: rhamnulokinase family protein [Pirellulales bacterium]|nr:rhamnulokinase family protein [Pirellulales bacterium]